MEPVVRKIRPPERNEPVATSRRIRDRLRNAGVRHHANDNIAHFLEPGEIEQLELEVADKAQALLRALVIDVEHDHNTRDTAQRLARKPTACWSATASSPRTRTWAVKPNSATMSRTSR